MLDIREHQNGVIFPVNVQTRSKKTEIVGIRDGSLKIKVLAPPVEGAANEAVKKLLSQVLGVSKSSIEILKGKASHHKLIQCQNLGQKEVQRILKNTSL